MQLLQTQPELIVEVTEACLVLAEGFVEGEMQAEVARLNDDPLVSGAEDAEGRMAGLYFNAAAVACSI